MKIIADPRLYPKEVEMLVYDEVREWAKLGKEIATIELETDGSEVVIQVTEKSPIKRVRRITGYLSNIENFNEAKQAECRDRYKHAE